MVLALLRSLWVILKAIPWQVYAAIGAVLFLWALYVAIDHRGFERGVKVTDVKWEAKEAETRRLQKIADVAAQKQLDAAQALAVKQQLDHEAELQALEKQRRIDLADLRKRLATYVTPLQLSRCPDVPRGFLRFDADAAAFANGAPNPTPAQPSAESLDAPSGISLSTYADTVAERAAAYRACSARQDGWLKYKADVEAWASAVQHAIQGVQQ